MSNYSGAGKETISTRLKELREKNGYKRKDMCNFLNIGEKAYGKYEQGTRYPDILTLPEIAKKLNTTTDYLLSGIKPSKTDQLYTLIRDYDESTQEKIIELFEKVLSVLFPKDTP